MASYLDSKTQIVGNSAKLQEVIRTAALVSATELPILIIGDTGTGKELFSRSIHEQSTRQRQGLATINCSSLPEEFAESLLFGQVSEEAAENKLGYIAQQHQGTLFLDDVSELSLGVQAKLLNLLEKGEIQHGGDMKPRKYDVRIIAASNKNLSQAVKAGNFREDLFYRLNVIPIELPTLAEREGDVSLLMDHFFRELVSKQHIAPPSFTKSALNKIVQYNWPGNVRELHNFCERMFILFSGKEVAATNLPQEFRTNLSLNSDSPFSLPATGIKLESVEVDLMQQALQKSNGNKSHAANLLGLTRDTFLYRLKKYSITA